MHFRTAFAALAAVGAVSAQSTQNKICSPGAGKTHLIENQADAAALSSCKKFTGNIQIGEDVVEAINLDGIEELNGNLIAIESTSLPSLGANSLTTITGTMQFKSLTIMSSLVMPVLQEVGAIEWITLNALQQLTFSAPLSKAKRIFITDTALTSLDGINLNEVESFEITNNAFLRTISTQVGNITSGLVINNNGPNLKLSFPNLQWAYNMTVRNASDFSIPSLEWVNTTFGVYGSYMEDIVAPNLTKIGGDAAFVGNAKLTNISMPLLETIGGGLLIANCSNLLAIDGFPKLRTTGAVNISGNFTKAELNSLEDVKGTFNAQSSGNFSCDTFDDYKGDQVVKGLYFCRAESDNVQASVTETKGGVKGPKQSDEPEGSAAGLAVSGAAGFGALLAAIFAL